MRAIPSLMFPKTKLSAIIPFLLRKLDFPGILIILINCGKHGNGNSKFSGFFLCKCKIQKPADDNNKVSRFLSYAIRYNKTKY
jgi:hypothetical protein